MTCEIAKKIHAFHDGELPVAERAMIESHLPTCAECASLLKDLRRMSDLFASVELPEISAHAIAKINATWVKSRAVKDRGMRRFAGGLTAAAAMLTIIMLRVPETNNAPRQTSDDALAMGMMPLPDNGNDVTQTAQWMADDLSANASR